MMSMLRWPVMLIVFSGALWLFSWQRNHYISVGADRVQKQWDAERRQALEEALTAEAQKRAQELQKRQETERIAHENHQLQMALIERNRVAVERERGLLDALAELDERLADQERASADAVASALAREARTAAQLLGRCTGRYRSVAAAADALKDQVIGLQDYANHVCHVQEQE